MASKKSNLSSIFPQRKKGSTTNRKTTGKGRSPSNKKKLADNVQPALEETKTASATLGSSKPQPAALMTASGMDVNDLCDDLEQTLRDFDIDMRFGPCIGMTRLERWERAQKLGMNPPQQVKEILERVGGTPTCLWEGMV